MRASFNVCLLRITSNNFLGSSFSGALCYQSNFVVSTLQTICILWGFYWLGIVTDACEPCPSNGECNDGKLECLQGYQRHGNLCVEDGDISQSARKIVCVYIFLYLNSGLLFLELNTVYYFSLFFCIFFISFWLTFDFDHRWREWNVTCVRDMLNFCAVEPDQCGLVFSCLTLGVCSLLVFIYVWLYTLLLELFLVLLISTSFCISISGPRGCFVESFSAGGKCQSGQCSS